MAQVFISYSRVDTAFVELFIRRLQHAFPDLKIWHDQAPHGLIGGFNWWDDILSAIAASDVFIYILSNESVSSVYCQAEFTEARRLQKHIITVQARDRTELTDDLDDIQFINMKDGVDGPDALPSLVAAINLRLKEAEKSRGARPLWKPATPKPNKEAPPVRAADAPDVTTPALSKPAGEVEALRLQREAEQRQTRLTLLGIGVTVVVTLFAALIELIPWLTERAESAATQAALAAPLRLARAGVTANGDWTALTQDFDGVAMMLVPAGCFTMGGDPRAGGNQMDGGRVCFDAPFWIDRYEVTQGDFARLGGVQANDSYFTGDSRPVERITWFEARDFCALRGGRLPTEAEWEYAARGPDGLLFPWGNDFDSDLVVGDRYIGQGTVYTGSIPGGASWVGALDLSGNVWEWTLTLYNPYPYPTTSDGSPDDAAWIAAGNSTDVRSLRGGSWNNTNTNNFRAANRFSYNPDFGDYYVGFRCLRSS